MDYHILLINLTNPVLLFFLLGVIATIVRSDLEIPRSSSKFISLYLLFSIGFKGGQELAHSVGSSEISMSILFGLITAAVIPVYIFFFLRRRLSPSDAGAVAATYGSVSAVTFVSAVSFLEMEQIAFGGRMVAVMALMEAPAIIVGVILIDKFQTDTQERRSLRSIFGHSFTNGSVLLILGSLVIGLVADTRQAEGIKPFTSDIFKGFLAVFLLEMGMVAAGRFKAFVRQGWSATLFALAAPPVAGTLAVLASSLVPGMEQGDRFLLAILAASASYIAAPAALRVAVPQANTGLAIACALGVTFPFNLLVGIPLYLHLAPHFVR